jgi:hypothetical protein
LACATASIGGVHANVSLLKWLFGVNGKKNWNFPHFFAMQEIRMA